MANPSSGVESRRARQAREEVGHTEVGRPVALALVLVTAVAVAGPPLAQTAMDLAAGRGPAPALAPLLAEVGGGLSGDWEGAADANRSLLAAMGTSEDRLEDESWLRSQVLPRAQAIATGGLGLGNEQVVSGRGGWLYLAADYSYTVGRGFLEPAVIAARERDEGVAADPLPALVGFAAALRERGIDLLVVPVPAKPAVVPGPLATGAAAPPVHNASFGLFLERAAEAGLEVFDPTTALLELEGDGTPAFLRTDTHWTPAGLERVASGIAARLAERGVAGRAGEYYRRPAVVEGRGDLATLLALPERSRAVAGERVESSVVLTAEGDPWRPSARAEVLLLGDSFTNVYSEPGLGWGGGAGLGEQLSFHLGAAVDRIARNAGGAHQSRSELAAELAAGRDRLAGKRVVVYQFAARELASGDWRRVALE